MSNEHDPLEERLRASLSASADEVDPAGSGLGRIRERIAEKQSTSFWEKLRTRWLAKPAFAAGSSIGVIALGLTAAVGVGQVSAGKAPFGIGDDPTTPTPTSTSQSTQPSTSESSKASGPDKTKTKKPDKTGKDHKPPADVTVPVYHIVSVSDGYELSQSSQEVTVSGPKQNRQEERAEGAYEALYGGGAQLRTTGAGVWAAGTVVEDADLEGSTLEVHFSSAAGSGNVSTAEAARAALKQVVYTGLDSTPDASSVQILVGGAPVSSFWGILPIDPNGVQRGDSALTKPYNTITAPSPGSVEQSPVTIAGEGAYVGGQVHWEVKQNGQVIKSGTASTGTNGFASWSRSVDLAAGSYRLTTFEQSDSGRGHAKSVNFEVAE